MFSKQSGVGHRPTLMAMACYGAPDWQAPWAIPSLIGRDNKSLLLMAGSAWLLVAVLGNAGVATDSSTSTRFRAFASNRLHDTLQKCGALDRGWRRRGHRIDCPVAESRPYQAVGTGNQGTSHEPTLPSPATARPHQVMATQEFRPQMSLLLYSSDDFCLRRDWSSLPRSSTCSPKAPAL